MYEFQDTMKQWRRMCKMSTCSRCPLNEICTSAPASHTNAEIARTEEVITNLAEEHPEPVYPTWEMYLAEMMTADMRDGKTHNPQSVEEYVRRTRIPADIAEKLGLEPKSYIKEAEQNG